MRKITLPSFFTKSFLLILLCIGSFHYSQAQVLHSATDSVMLSGSFYTDSNSSEGFTFSPTQDLFVAQLGKRLPDSASISWIIWDAETRTKIYQQKSTSNIPTQYIYENIDPQVALILKKGVKYNLQLFFEDSVGIYSGSAQVGQHLIYHGSSMCQNCDTNTFPTDLYYAPYQYGVPDFLYSLIPLKRGMNDAAVVSVDTSKLFCPGLKDIYATIGNYGFNQIDSLEVHWEFNGIPQPTIKYTQLLDTINGIASSTARLLLGSKNFDPGENNLIKVWTSMPNGISDTVIYGDTMEVNRKARLSGNFTINPSQPIGNGNYQSFSDLAIDLNTLGICGPVYVTVAPGTYHDFLHLKEILGVSAINTVTIDGQDSSTTILTHDGSSSSATVTLDGADYVTIRNMGIQASDTLSATVILFNPGADHNAILNNELLANNNTRTGISNIEFKQLPFDATANYNNISNNKIEGGYYGIYTDLFIIFGSLPSNNKIMNNEISNVFYGINVKYQDSLQIIDNKINNVGERNSYPYPYALYLTLNEASSIENNYINGSCYLTGNASRIINNMIIANSNHDPSVYIDGDNISIFHNSISSNGHETALKIGFSASLLDVRNNIFSAKYGPAMVVNYSMSSFDSLDYNIYFTKGKTLLNVGGTAGINFSNLSAFQSAYPSYNSSSIEGNPHFLSSDSNLHVVGLLANDAGDNSVNISGDIDGDARPFPNSTLVDIGADEFDPPSCLPPFELTASKPSLDSISLSWEAGTGSASYQYKILEKDSSAPVVTMITASDSLRIGNLKIATGYNFYVRSICGRNDTSLWWGPKTFYTADTISYFENFEAFDNNGLINGWTAESSRSVGTFWQSATSASAYGGPAGDHSIGTGGTFVYLKNTASPADSLDLISPPIYVDSSDEYIEFTFWYHMYGTPMGDLKVFVDTNGVSNPITILSGQQQDNQTDPWRQFSTYLNGYQGKYIRLRFEGVKGTGAYSSIFIDDVSLDTVPDVNTGIVELISPKTFCSGTFTPIVGLQNLGDIPVDSVKVLWEINGILSDSIIYTNTILPGDTAAVPLKNIILNPGSHYSINFYTKDPNSIADPITIDDTLKFESGLSGSYRISDSLPASDSTFKNFTEAAYALNTFGICGPVYITADSGLYNEAVVLREINGTSSTNTIVFDGQDSSACILSHDGSIRFATWTFDGTDYVTLKNMSIINTNSQQGASILIANTAEHNTIVNNELKVSVTSTPSGLSNVLFSGSSNSGGGLSNASYNLIANNKIEGGIYGINANGDSSSVHNKIINNQISQTYLYGIFAASQDSLEVSGNVIDVASNGITISSPSDVLLQANIIHSGWIGISVSSGISTIVQRTRIVNNTIVSDDGSSIFVGQIIGVEIFHNSLYTGDNRDAVLNIDLFNPIAALSSYDVRNNIFSAETTEAISTDAPDYIFNALDNNLYYTEGDTLLRIDGIGYADLAAYQTASPSFNNNSIEGNPQFASATDLHIIGSFVNDKGDNTVGVTEDIDGDPRPMPGSTTVDIGADEFDPPSCPPVYDLSASDVFSRSVLLQWSGGNGFFEYEIVLKDSAQGSGIIDTTLYDSLRVGGLAPGTDYEYYAREICGAGDTSIWWGPIAFSTPAEVNDLSVGSILSPVQIAKDSCIAQTTSSVELSIVNRGNTFIDFSQDTTDIHLDVTGAAVQSYSYQINDNSLNASNLLAPDDSITVTFGTLTMGSTGTYKLKTYLELSVDSNNSNDTLVKTIIHTSAGLLSATEDSICAPKNVILDSRGAQGALQWQRLVGGVFTDETGAGADSDSYQVFIDSTTSFRLVSCGSVFSDTLTIELINATKPVAFDSTLIIACGDTGTVALVVGSGDPNAVFEWFGVPTGGSPLTVDSNIVGISANGDTLYYRGSSIDPNNPSIDTFYVQETTAISGEMLLITEMDLGFPDMFEIQNVSSRAIDVTGWTVAVSNSHTDINQNTYVTLTDTMKPGDIRTWSNSGTIGDAWPSIIPWNPGGTNTAWAMILDEHGIIVDVVFENWAPVQIQAMNTTINGHPINITNEWIGYGLSGTNVSLYSSFQRIGYSDNNDSADFVLQNTSHEVINPGLNLPFISKRCISARDTVIATIDCIVGLEETNNSFGKLSIYPNPSKGIFSVVGENVEDKLQITLYNPNGKLVYQHDSQLMNTFNEQIDISHLAKGVYYLKIQGYDSFEMRKIIIN